jgi:putative tricarboxylic transport membrane protein
LALLFKRFGNSFLTSIIAAAMMTAATKYLFGYWLLVPLPIGKFGL